MKRSLIILSLFLGFLLLPNIYALQSVEIATEKPIFTYCEKLSYTIKVSEITGQPATIHIIDQTGKSSSAISIPIMNQEKSFKSPYPFESESYPLGKYSINIEYNGTKNTTQFELVDLGNICIPLVMKKIAYSWIDNQLSDGFFLDSINKFVDKKAILIEKQINKENIMNVQIPSWVKNTTIWLLEDKISDTEYAHAIQYLLDKEIILI